MLEYPRPEFSQWHIFHSPTRLKPLVEVLTLVNDDRGEHVGMLRSAVLRAIRLILAGFRGLKPDRRISVGKHILLDAERRYEEAMDDILAAHLQADWSINRHVELTRRPDSVGILELPQPHSCRHVNLIRIRRRC